MKVTVTKTDVSVEGDAAEIREAMPSILGTAQQQSTADRFALEAQQHVAALPPSGSSGVDFDPLVEEMIEVQSAPEIMLPHERVAANEWTPIPGAVSPLPVSAFERWEDIPEDRRMWGSTAFTCHVLRDSQDPFSTFCGHDVGMPKRPGYIPDGAKPCGNCMRRIEEGARP